MDRAVRVFTSYLIADRHGSFVVRTRKPKLADLRTGQFAFELKLRVPIEEREIVLGSVTIELPPESDPIRRPAIQSITPLEVAS